LDLRANTAPADQSDRSRAAAAPAAEGARQRGDERARRDADARRARDSELETRTLKKERSIMKSKRLRELFARSQLISAAGAHDGVSAKLVEANGFDVVWASGFEISTSHAVPDASILTMVELLEAARNMNEATTIPVMADCDSGFGEVRNVVHMVRKYEAAGIAAVCIEDKRFPKLNSFVSGAQTLVSSEEFCDKIAAAKSAQINADFMIVARIEAFIAGLDEGEALRRAHAYGDAGADAILIHSKQPTPREVFGFARRWQNRLPVVIVPTTYYETTADEIEQAGIQMVIYANHAMRAAVKAMDETLAKIRQSGTTRAIEHSIAPMQRLFELQGLNP
jgi:phosphoenolpyruvate phosphomutase